MLKGIYDIIKQVMQLLKEYDMYTFNHCYRVGEYAYNLAKLLDLSEEERILIKYGGYVHDIGKLFITPTVLFKKDTLTNEEYDKIKKHPKLGSEFLIKYFIEKDDNVRKIIEMVDGHHERVDGAGYPEAVMSNTLYIGTRIISICDTFDAITSNRIYRKGSSVFKALEVISSVRGTQLDYELSDVFIRGINNGLIVVITQDDENVELKKTV